MADGPWSIALTFDMFKYLYIRVQYLEDDMGMKDHAFAQLKIVGVLLLVLIAKFSLPTCWRPCYLSSHPHAVNLAASGYPNAALCSLSIFDTANDTILSEKSNQPILYGTRLHLMMPASVQMHTHLASQVASQLWHLVSLLPTKLKTCISISIDYDAAHPYLQSLQFYVEKARILKPGVNNHA